MEHIKNAIDWTSVKLNGICFLGFLTGKELLIILSVVATISTIIYNGVRIYKEFKK